MAGAGREKLRRQLDWADRHDQDATRLALLRKRLGTAGSDPWIRFQYGCVLHELGRPQDAVRHLQFAWRRCAAKHRGLVAGWLGHVYQAIGDEELMKEWFARSIELDPAPCCTFLSFGDFYRGRGQLKEALNYYGRAARCEDGPIAEAYVKVAVIYRALERLDEAIDAARTAVVLSPNYAAAKKVVRDCHRAKRILK